MKLVYMGDSKSPAERRAGSSPAAGTTFYSPDQIGRGFFMPTEKCKRTQPAVRERHAGVPLL